MAPGFGLTITGRLPAFAERFQGSGYNVLLFDHLHFGSSQGSPRQLLKVRQQLSDWSCAIRFVKTLPVDREKIALWGTSFSGGHVITTAAREPSVAAVIAQVPFLDGARMIKVLGVAATLRLTLAATRDLLHAATGMEPYRVRIAGHPGSLAALPISEAREGYSRLLSPDRSSQEIAARVFMTLPLYRPIAHAKKVRCPLLIQAMEEDAITPAALARKAARIAPEAEYQSWSGGHFDIYHDSVFEAAVERQLAFLDTVLG
jgi:uncharacterized protein